MLYYERRGSGPTLVCIHGFLGSSKIYDEVKEDFISSYDTIFIDFAGHGHSSQETVEPSIYNYAEQIVEVLQKEQVTSATWLGHSMGGYIVLAALEKQLATIDKTILAYSSTGADSEEAKAKRDASVKAILTDGKEAFIDGVIPNFFKKNAATALVETGRHIAYAASNDGLISALQTMKSRPNQEALLEQLTIPVLVIEGTEDGVVPPIETTNSYVQKATTNTGHLGMLEEPEQFCAHVRKFMAD